MKPQNSPLLTGLVLFSIGYALLSDPKCNRGCRTIAEHLLSHAINDLFGLA